MNQFQKTTNARERGEPSEEYLHFWQLWHHNWDDADIVFFREHGALDGKRVLEVGCGDGRVAFGLAPQCEKLVAIDLHPTLVDAALGHLRRTPVHGLTFQIGNAEMLEFDDESFDAVLFPWVLQMVSDPRKAIEEGYRVLRKGGRTLVIGLTSDADYDQIIEQFTGTKATAIDREALYNAPLTDVFRRANLQHLGLKRFDYFFESAAIAYAAFMFAFDRWYGTTLNTADQQRLREVLKRYEQPSGRVCMKFMADTFVAIKR